MKLYITEKPVIVPGFNFGLFGTWPNKENKKKKGPCMQRRKKKERKNGIAVECKKKVDTKPQFQRVLVWGATIQ